MDLSCNENIADLDDSLDIERLLLLEPLYVINEDYFRTIQTEISSDMRQTCLEWLWEVSYSDS